MIVKSHGNNFVVKIGISSCRTSAVSGLATWCLEAVGHKISRDPDQGTNTGVSFERHLDRLLRVKSANAN